MVRTEYGSKLEILDAIQEALDKSDYEKLNYLRGLLAESSETPSQESSFIAGITGKTIYNNLIKCMDEGLPRDEMVKMFCSLITHYVIEAEKSGKPYSSYNIHEVYSELGSLIIGKEDSEKRARDYIIKRYRDFV